MSISNQTPKKCASIKPIAEYHSQYIIHCHMSKEQTKQTNNNEPRKSSKKRKNTQAKRKTSERLQP